jgi:diaminopimelate decarboxylase
MERRSTSTPPTRLPSGSALFQQAFAGRDHLVCYAVKANSALAILKLLADRGAGFDIVSGGELERVLAAAPDAAGRVVFSGVGKTRRRSISRSSRHPRVQRRERGRVGTARRPRRQAQTRKARFALRVNPDVFADTHPYISTGLREHKFGIDIRQALAHLQKARRQSLA